MSKNGQILKCSTWVQSQKGQNDLDLFPTQTTKYHSNPSLCLNHWCWKSWRWQVLWRPTTLSRTNIKNRCPFNHRELECKVGSQGIPRITGNFALKVGQRLTVLSREHAGHSKHPFTTTQKMILYMDITRWSKPKSDWLCFLQLKMEKLHRGITNEMWNWVWIRS